MPQCKRQAEIQYCFIWKLLFKFSGFMQGGYKVIVVYIG